MGGPLVGYHGAHGLQLLLGRGRNGKCGLLDGLFTANYGGKGLGMEHLTASRSNLLHP